VGLLVRETYSPCERLTRSAVMSMNLDVTDWKLRIRYRCQHMETSCDCCNYNRLEKLKSRATTKLIPGIWPLDGSRQLPGLTEGEWLLHVHALGDCV